MTKKIPLILQWIFLKSPGKNKWMHNRLKKEEEESN